MIPAKCVVIHHLRDITDVRRSIFVRVCMMHPCMNATRDSRHFSIIKERKKELFMVLNLEEEEVLKFNSLWQQNQANKVSAREIPFCSDVKERWEKF